MTSLDALAMTIQIIAEVGKQTAPEPAVRARFLRIEAKANELRKLLEAEEDA